MRRGIPATNGKELNLYIDKLYIYAEGSNKHKKKERKKETKKEN
jgi:hypothetical protein